MVGDKPSLSSTYGTVNGGKPYTLPTTPPSASTTPSQNGGVGKDYVYTDEVQPVFDENAMLKEQAARRKKRRKQGYAWTPGEQQQVLAGLVGPAANIIRGAAGFRPVMPKYNKYAYQAHDQLSRNRVTPDNAELRAAYTNMDRSVRDASANTSVNTSNRLAAYNAYNRQIGQAEKQAQVQNQTLANNASQALANIGAQEAQAEENARKETNMNRVAKFQMVGKGIEQMGTVAGKVGEMMVDKEEQEFEWNIMAKHIYKDYGLAAYQAVMRGEVSFDDIIRYKGLEGAQEAARAAKAAQAEKYKQTADAELTESEREIAEAKAEKDKQKKEVRREIDPVTGKGMTLETTTTTTEEE